MDRNDSNPGMVERQMDESPLEGASSSDRELSRDGLGGMDRDSMQGDGVEREGMQDGPVERDSMQGSGSPERESLDAGESERPGESNTTADDAEMRSSGREGGYGYDRPADLAVSRDTMEGSSRGTDQGTDRANDVSRGSDQPRGTTTARDW